MTIITIDELTLLRFNKVKGIEALRVQGLITNIKFVNFLLECYSLISNDTMVLDEAWKRVYKQMGISQQDGSGLP